MNTALYLNFDLLVLRVAEGYAARVVSSPAGEAAVEFQLPFGDEVLQPFFANTGRKIRQTRTSHAPVPDAPVDVERLGRQLFAAVFAQDVGKCLLLSLQKAKATAAHLRIRLRLDQAAPELAEIPWEYLYAPDWECFPALFEQTPIVRYIEQMRSVEPLRVTLPLHILAVLASPEDAPPLEVDQEWKRLRNATKLLREHKQITLDKLKIGTLDALRIYLRKNDVHILHFIGHGFFDAQSQRSGLIFTNEAKQSQQVTAMELATLLNNHKALRLVFLNACEGARAGNEEFFAGAAQTLVQQGIPAVIAMQFPVTDQAALTLSSTFYCAIADGLPVDAALTEARKNIFIQGNTWEWGTPVFFSRSPDNTLFDIEDTRPKPTCPYPGMIPFAEQDSANFFGRDAEIKEAIDRLHLRPFLTVIGPSGSGKSSLVYAGVLPALRASKRFGVGDWQVLTMRPGEQPLSTLLQHFGAATASDLLKQQLVQRTLLFIDQFEEAFTAVRQSASEPQGRDQFLALLGQLANRSNLFIILTVRADFYPDLMASPLWPQIKANRLELAPMGAKELRTALVRPAEQVGVTIEPLLVERLLTEAAGEPGVLPLVQETLVQLWEHLEKRRLPYSVYLAMADLGRSGLQVAIARRADVAFAGLPEDGQALARRIFLRLVQFGEGRADTRRQLPVAKLLDAADDTERFETTLQVLALARLLTLSAGENERSDQRRVDIAHEALISGWPLMQEWLKQRRDSEQVRRRLEGKADDWLRLGQGVGGLLDQFELREAEQWLENPNRVELGSSQTLLDLIKESRAALEVAEAEKEAAHQRELKAAQQLAEARKLDLERAAQLRVKDIAARNRLMGLLAATAALLVVAVVAWIWISRQSTALANSNQQLEQRSTDLATANRELQQKTLDLQDKTNQLQERSNALGIALNETKKQQQAAEYNAREATANKFAAQAQSLLSNNDITTALNRARTAVVTTFDTDKYVAIDADLALRRALGLYAFRSTLPYFRHVGGINALALSPDGKLIASASDDQGVRLWEYASGRHHRFFGNLGGGVETVVFSPDGALLAAAGQDTAIRIWNVTTGDLLQTLKGHRAAVRNLAFRPDGQRLLSSSEDKTALVWNVRDWQPLLNLTGHDGTVYMARFSPDGKRIASVAKDGRLRLWNAETGVLQHTIRVSDRGVRALVFAPDGAQVATAGDEGIISLWDAERGTALFTLPSHDKAIQSLTMSRDGTQLASAADDSTLKLWNLRTKTLVRTFQGEEEMRKEFNAVLFSVDELALISAGGDRAIRVWHIADGQEQYSFPGHVDAVLSAAFSPDSTRLVTVGKDQQIRFWDVAAGTTAQLWQTHVGNLYAVTYSADEQHLAIAGEAGLLQVWDVLHGTVALTLTGHNGDVTTLAYSADGKRLVSGGADGTIRLWDVQTGHEAWQMMADAGGIRSVAFSPLGSRVVSAGQDGVLRLWNSIDGKLQAALVGHEGAIDAVAFSSDGTLLASTGEDHTVRIWSVQDKVVWRIFQGHTERVRAVAFSPDNKRLASGGDDRTVRLWNVERGEAIRILTGHADIIRALAYSPDGNTLVSTAGGTTGNNSIRLWTVKPLAERFKLEPHGDVLRWATFSPDDKFIATACDDGKVRIWDGESEALLQVMNAHHTRVRTVAFSVDSHLLVSAGDDHVVRVWAVGSWQLVAELVGHMGWVRSAFFSPDGKTVVSASEDKTIRLWNVATGAEIRQFIGHEDVIVFATFSPDGKEIASAGFDGTVRLWEVSTGRLLRTFSSQSRFNNIVAFSPDGMVLAIGTGDSDNVNQVQFWQVATGEEVYAPLPHKGPVRGVAFSQDGQWLLTAGHGNPVQLWDLAQNRLLRTFTEHDKSVWSVNFSPTGSFFITASEDRTARLWFTRVEEQIALADELLQRDPPIFMPEQRSHLTNPGEP